jgi:streptogramin lyase
MSHSQEMSKPEAKTKKTRKVWAESITANWPTNPSEISLADWPSIPAEINLTNWPEPIANRLDVLADRLDGLTDRLDASGPLNFIFKLPSCSQPT